METPADEAPTGEDSHSGEARAPAAGVPELTGQETVGRAPKPGAPRKKPVAPAVPPADNTPKDATGTGAPTLPDADPPVTPKLPGESAPGKSEEPEAGETRTPDPDEAPLTEEMESPAAGAPFREDAGSGETTPGRDAEFDSAEATLPGAPESAPDDAPSGEDADSVPAGTPESEDAAAVDESSGGDVGARDSDASPKTPAGTVPSGTPAAAPLAEPGPRESALDRSAAEFVANLAKPDPEPIPGETADHFVGPDQKLRFGPAEEDAPDAASPGSAEQVAVVAAPPGPDGPTDPVDRVRTNIAAWETPAETEPPAVDPVTLPSGQSEGDPPPPIVPRTPGLGPVPERESGDPAVGGESVRSEASAAADTEEASEAPVPQPEAPAQEPEAPAPQPEAPAPQPEAPAPQPEAPAPQPAPEPEAPAPQPEAPAQEPEAPAPEPEAPEPAPMEPATKPVEPRGDEAAAGASPPPPEAPSASTEVPATDEPRARVPDLAPADTVTIPVREFAQQAPAAADEGAEETSPAPPRTITLRELLEGTVEIEEGDVFYVHAVTAHDEQGLWGIIQKGVTENFARGVRVHVNERTTTLKMNVPPDADELLENHSSSPLGLMIHRKSKDTIIYNRRLGRLTTDPDVTIFPGNELIIVGFKQNELVDLFKRLSGADGG